MFANLSKYTEEKIRSTIHHNGLVEKLFATGDEAPEPDNASNTG